MRASPVAAALFAAASLAGCTFLIDFNTVDVPPDAADGEDASRPIEAAAPEAGRADAASDAFPPPCDTAFPLAQVKCASTTRACATDTTTVTAYPTGSPRTNDIVTCKGATGATCVQHCPNGCATMPSGYPDMCDDCAGRADGTYCVKDLRGGYTDDYDLAIDCKGGKTVAGHVCGANACATKCPRSSPLPSCCI